MCQQNKKKISHYVIDLKYGELELKSLIPLRNHYRLYCYKHIKTISI